MIHELRLITGVLVVVFLVLILIFDIWVYRATKNIDFVARFIVTKYRLMEEGLTNHQIYLLRLIALTKYLILFFCFLTAASILLS